MSFTFKLARRTARLRVAVCATALVAVFACNADENAAPALESEAADTSPADASAADGSAVETAGDIALSSSATAPGIAFGDYHLPLSRFKTPYTGALLALWSGTSAVTYLNAARNAGMRVVISLAGNRRYYTNSNGTFNLTKWKSRIAAFRNVSLNTYVSSGTILGHYLVDEPGCKSCWGGQPIPNSSIEEMARYSKSIWPSMATTVRAVPSRLASSYRYLDFAWAQWDSPLHGASFRMTPEQFRDKEVAAAKDRGLGLVFGLNYQNGGDGSSRINGTYAKDPNLSDNKYCHSGGCYRYAMSASEVKRVGAVLAASSYACALVSWRYDATVLARSGMSSAVSYVAGVAKNRARTGCVK